MADFQTSVAVGSPQQLVFGLADIRDKLEQLPKRVVTSMVRQALLAGANVIRDEARRRVPVRTGALKRSIISFTDKEGDLEKDAFGRPIQYKAYVTIDRKTFAFTPSGKIRVASRGKGAEKKGPIQPRQYAHLVEFGTKPHRLGRRGGMHPGAQPKPFMRSARDSKRAEAVQTMRRIILDRLDVELAKLAQKRKAG